MILSGFHIDHHVLSRFWRLLVLACSGFCFDAFSRRGTSRLSIFWACLPKNARSRAKNRAGALFARPYACFCIGCIALFGKQTQKIITGLAPLLSCAACFCLASAIKYSRECWSHWRCVSARPSWLERTLQRRHLSPPSCELRQEHG